MSMRDAPARKRSFLHVWFPWLVLLLSAAGCVTLLLLPGEKPQPENRRAYIGMIALTAFVALLVWFVTRPLLPWLLRIGAVAAVPILWFALVKEWRISRYGQFDPYVLFRWEPSDDDLLEEDRAVQPRAAGAPALTDEPTDFPEYRGRKRDGIVIGPALNRDWSAKPPRELWRHKIGGGYATFALAGNLAVTIEQRRDREAIVAYDPDTGHERWAHVYDARFDEALGGPGPRATPTIAGGDVFSLGATGWLICLDAINGKVKWAVKTRGGRGKGTEFTVRLA